MCLALALLGCEDFADAPTSSITVRQPSDAPWPHEVFVKNTFVLSMDVEGQGATSITGLAVDWQSTDSSVLALSPVEAGQTHEDSLVAQRSIRVVAQRRGRAEISATVIQLGFEAESLKQEVRVMERWVAVSAGSSHSCAITIDRDAFCWGAGLLGNGSASGSTVPVLVGRELKFRSVSAGKGHTCGVLLDGTVECWGLNSDGELGIGGPGDQSLPVLLSGTSVLDTLFAGDGYVCGLTSGMGAFCWGTNQKWQLGDGFIQPFAPPNGQPKPSFDDCGILFPSLCSRLPRRVRDRGSVTEPEGVPLELSSIAPGVTHTCALRVSGAAVCWGEGSTQLGSPVEVTTDSAAAEPFVDVVGGPAFGAITAGELHTCALAEASAFVYCWGFDTHGELGIATPDSSCQTFSEPPVVGCSSLPAVAFNRVRVSAIEAGGNSTCALGTNGTVYCWGSNRFGQLGDPALRGGCAAGPDCSTTAVEVDVGNGPAIDVSVGSRHACAVTALGEMLCWGDSSDGRLGAASINGTGPAAPHRVDEPT